MNYIEYEKLLRVHRSYYTLNNDPEINIRCVKCNVKWKCPTIVEAYQALIESSKQAQPIDRNPLCCTCGNWRYSLNEPCPQCGELD